MNSGDSADSEKGRGSEAAAKSNKMVTHGEMREITEGIHSDITIFVSIF
jgi:hypothetical protein